MNEKIINFIKKDFKENVLKGNLISQSDLIERALDYHAEEEELIYLNKYYEEIAMLSFLEKFDDFEELSFLGIDGIYLKSESNKSHFPFSFEKDDYEIMLIIICLKNHIDWNFNNPFVSFKLKTTKHLLRATIVHGSLGGESSSRLFLRKIQTNPFSLNQFFSDGHYLKELISKKKNLIICGPTGSGKTSLLSSLINEIKPHEHVITIEDTEELIYKNFFHTRLLANKSITMDELLSYSLRMTPERLILGEMRSKEVTTFLLAMNTGHKGLISTLHANSASDAIDRMALMFTLYQKAEGLNHKEVIKLISKSVDIIIYVEDKIIKEVVEIVGAENGVAYFKSIYEREPLTI